MSANAVAAVNSLKQNVGFLQKVLLCVTGSKVEFSAVLEAHRKCTGATRDALDDSLAMAVFMTRRCVLEVCKHGHFAQLKDLICKDDNRFGVDKLADEASCETFNLHLVELVLSKVMPAIGRNVRSPESLLTSLREIVSVLPDDALESCHQEALDQLCKAVRDVTDINDPVLVEESIAAIAGLGADVVQDTNFLAPFCGVTSFKGTLALQHGQATSRYKALTKSLVFSSTRKQLASLSFVSSECDISAVSAFYNLVLRSTAYVNEVVAKKVSNASKEISVYNQLLGDFFEKFSSFIEQCDVIIADTICKRTAGDIDAAKGILKDLQRFTNGLPFKEADFFLVDGAVAVNPFTTWQNLVGAVPARSSLVAALASLWAVPEASTELVLAAVMDVQSKHRCLKIPLSEACDKQLVDMVSSFNLSNKAASEFKVRFKAFIDEAFAGLVAKVPSDDAVSDMMRWTQYSMTPARDRGLVEATPGFAFLLSRQSEIADAVDVLETSRGKDKVLFADIIKDAVALFDVVMPLNDTESTVQRMEFLRISDQFAALADLGKKLRAAVGAVTGDAVKILNKALSDLRAELFAKVDPDKQNAFVLGEDEVFATTFNSASANSKLRPAMAALDLMKSVAKQVGSEAHVRLISDTTDAIAQCKGEINRAALLALLANPAFRQAQRGKPLRESAGKIVGSIGKLQLEKYMHADLLRDIATAGAQDAKAVHATGLVVAEEPKKKRSRKNDVA